MQAHGRRLGFAMHINFDMMTVCALSRPSAQRWTAEAEQLPVCMRARLVSLGSIIEAVGPTACRRIRSSIWKATCELRRRVKDGIARAIYVTAIRPAVMIVRVFVKKAQKTPKHELELARQRAKEVK